MTRTSTLLVITLLISTALATVPVGPASAAGLDGALAAAGDNTAGQLGTGVVGGSQSTLTAVDLDRVVRIDGGGEHSLAIDRDGALWTWGSNTSGQLARTTAGSAPSPSPSIVELAGTLLDADAGGAHTAWADANGNAFVVGSNSHGQSGRLTPGDSSTPSRVNYRLSTTSPLTPLSGVTAVAAGARTSFFVNADGVWGVGDNSSGQLGNGLVGASFNPIATRVTNLPDGIVDVVAGDGFAAALAADGRVWTWGSNALGQLGRPSGTAGSNPSPATAPSGIDAIAAGSAHVLAADLDEDTVHAWGSDAAGQLGDGPDTTTAATLRFDGLEEIAAGAQHSLARTTERVVTWGSDEHGQLARDGDGSSPADLGLDDAVAIAGGGAHTLVARAPSVSLSPDTVDFGAVDVGAMSEPVAFTFRNEGPGRVDITSVWVDNSIEFAVQDDTCTTAGSLVAGATCSVAIAFAPTDIGERGSGASPFATLTIESRSDTGSVSATMAGRGTLTPGSLTLTVDPPSVPASPDRVPTDLLPYAATSPDVETAPGPVGLSGLRLSPGPIGISGLRLSPGSVGISGLRLAPGSVGISGLRLAPGPIGLSGLRLSPGAIGLSALRLSARGSDVLDSISLAQLHLVGSSWYDVLPDLLDPLRPLNEVPLSEALALDIEAFEQRTLGELDLASSPLGGITVAGALTGAVPLIAYPSVAADPEAACQHLEDAGHPDCGADLAMADDPALAPLKGLTASLLLLDVAKVSHVDLVDLDTIAVSEMADAFDGETTVVVDGTQYDLAYPGAGLTSMSALGLSWNQSDLGSRTASQVAADVRCEFFDCGHPAYSPDITIAEAAASSALQADATFDQLFAASLGDTSVGQVMLTALVTGQRPDHAVSLDSLVRHGLATAGSTDAPATYTAHWDNPGGADLTDVTVSVELHESMWPLAGTGRVTVGGETSPASPVVSRGPDGRITLAFAVERVPADGTASVAFDALAGPREGTVSASADGSASSGPLAVTPEQSQPIVLTITPNHEPNDHPDELTSAGVIEVRDADADLRSVHRSAGQPLAGGGELVLNQVSDASDVDWFAIAPTDSTGAPIDVLQVTNAQKDDTQVVALYYPSTSEFETPLRDPHGDVEDLDEIHELGAAVTETDQPLPPGTRPALPGDGLDLRLADFSATESLAADVLVAVVPERRALAPGEPWWHDMFLVAVESAAASDGHAGVSVLGARALSAHVGKLPAATDLSQCDSPLPRVSGPTLGWPTPAQAAGVADIYLVDTAALRASDPSGVLALSGAFDRLAADPAVSDFVVADVAANPDLADEIAARQLHRCDHTATNALVRAINDELDELENDTAGRSILGDARGVPMGWIADPSAMASGQELTYAGPLAAEGGDPELVTGYASGRYPSDAAYGASRVLGLRGTYFYPRALPVARQLGSASQIATALDALAAADGSFTIGSGATQSTDWMTTFGEAAAAALAAEGLTVATSRHDQSLTSQDILDALDDGDVHVGGLHGSATGVYDSNGARITAGQLTAAAGTSLVDLVLGPYCHAATPVSSTDGIAAAFGTIARSSVLNTTYGMGVEDANVLNTRILLNVIELADEVARPTELVNRAVQDAFLADLDFGVHAPKAAMGTTVFGLTRWTNADVVEDSTTIDPATSIDPFSGLEYSNLDLDLVSGRERVETDFGSYWALDGLTTSRAGGPIQPVATAEVPDDATGALWIGGSETVIDDVDLTHHTAQLSGSPENLVELDAVGPQGPKAEIRSIAGRSAMSFRAGYATDLRRHAGRVIGDEHLVDHATLQVFRGDPTATDIAEPALLEAVKVDDTHVAFEVEFDETTDDAVRVVVVVDDRVGDLDFVELIRVAPDLVDGEPVPGQLRRFAGLTEVAPDTTVLALVQTLSASGAVHGIGPLVVTEQLDDTVGYTFSVQGQQTSTGSWIDPVVVLTPDHTGDVIEYAVGAGAFERYTGPFPLTGSDRLVPIRVRVTDSSSIGHHWVLKEGDGQGHGDAGPEITIRAPGEGQRFVVGAAAQGLVTCLDANGFAAGTITFRKAGAAQPISTVTMSSPGASPTLPTSTPGTILMSVECTDRAGFTSGPVVRTYLVTFDASEGFLSPIQNLPAINPANPGSTLRVQFRLLDASGASVGQVSDVRGVHTYRVPGPGCASPGSCPSVETRGYKDLRVAGDKLVLEVESKASWICQRRRLVVLLVDDTTLEAEFDFTKNGC